METGKPIRGNKTVALELSYYPYENRSKLKQLVPTHM
jgi:hypothetical protein